MSAVVPQVPQLLGIVTTVATLLLSGGLIGRWWTYRTQMHKLDSEDRQKAAEEKRLDFEMLLSVVTRQRDEAYKTIDKLNERIEAMELEIQGLRLSAGADPFPNWIVDLEGRYIFVNREFEKTFLEPRGENYRDIIGKHHSDLWPPAFCQTIRQLDSVARSNAAGTARAKAMLEGREVTLHKFPYRLKGVPVAYSGYITEIEDLPS